MSGLKGAIRMRQRDILRHAVGSSFMMIGTLEEHPDAQHYIDERIGPDMRKETEAWQMHHLKLQLYGEVAMVGDAIGDGVSGILTNISGGGSSLLFNLMKWATRSPASEARFNAGHACAMRLMHVVALRLAQRLHADADAAQNCAVIESTQDAAASLRCVEVCIFVRPTMHCYTASS